MSSTGEDDPTTTLGNPRAFSWAITSLFAFLVPHISMTIGEYHRALGKSPQWSTQEHQTTGKRAIRIATYKANAFCLLLIIGTACGVALNTQNLDDRMVSILVGLSRLMGSIVIFALSWNFPEWLEVYHIRARPEVLDMGVSRSIKALKFNVTFSIFSEYFKVFFFLMLFYCGVSAAAIPVSAIVGIVVGAVVDLMVYWVNAKVDQKGLTTVFCMIFVAVVSSAILFASGCNYINNVWGFDTESNSQAAVISVAFFAWFLTGALIHFWLYRVTRESLEDTQHDRNIRRSIAAKSIKYKNALGKAIVEKGPKTMANTVDKIKHAAQKGSGNNNNNNKTPELVSGEDTFFDKDKDEEDHPQKSVGFAANSKDMIEVEIENTHIPKDEEQDATNEEGDDYYCEDDVFNDPTYESLIRSRCGCCCCGAGGCFAHQHTSRAKWLHTFKWTIWTLSSLFCIFLVAINIGATIQQDVVRELLPGVKGILYDNMNDIEVCSYDGNGTAGSLNENSNITTFESKEASQAAGFLILHCGPCAKCSTFPNIKYEYTTRSFLAAESRDCAKKALGGGENAVLKCLTSSPISWDNDCGKCWLNSVLCAKDNCALNYIQSVFINAVTDMRVGQNHVTSASCEEAHCEAFSVPENFVECSGATRRRMNVTSTIERPHYESCANVQVSWATLFPGE